MPANVCVLEDAPKCPSCGQLLDATAEVNNTGAKPGHGDVSICCYCATVARYRRKPDGTLALDALTDEQIENDIPRYLQEPIKKARHFLLSKMN